jgi:hypothetical protein
MARKWEQQSRSHFSLPTAATLSKLVLVHLCDVGLRRSVA